MEIGHDFTKFLSECDYYEMRNIRGELTDNYYEAVYITACKNGDNEHLVKTHDFSWRPAKVFLNIAYYYNKVAELINELPE